MRIAPPRARRAAAVSAALAALLAAGATAVAAQADEAEALARLLSHETVVERDGEPVVRLVQRVEVSGCDAVVTTTHYAPGTDRRRMTERSRFEIEHMDPIEREDAANGLPASIDLTARDYFVRAGDRGLSRWLDALAETRASQDRAAEMRALQLRIERGEFGAFARQNGYEMRSFLEGDPEPYYSMPLPALSLALPEEAAAAARAAWSRYADAHCAG